jgi:CO/xanthine dehydrogenase FAD-binding subunit
LKPGKFEYFDPADADEALGVLARYGDEAKVLSGGQSLVPMLSMRLAYPAALLDINRLPGLDHIREGAAGWEIGALARHARAEDSDELATALPVIRQAMRWVGHRAIRNRGTVVGSLAHADPAAEMPAVMTAVDATVTAQGPSGTRSIPLTELFEMPLVSTVAPDEILVDVRIPRRAPGEGSAVVEVARRHGDFALAGVVALVALDAAGAIASARLVSFATGPVPQRLEAAESLLAGALPGAEAYAAAGEAAAGGIDPGADIHASAEYRRSVTSVLVGRALDEAVTNARARSQDPSEQR